MLAKQCALVIPSSVYVNARYTQLTDYKQRQSQYIDAIGYYLRETGLQRIIVCDNSGYLYPDSLYELAAIYGKQLELLSFLGDNELVKQYGKGYGEGQIMSFVLRHSKLLQQAEGFFKVTGRLKVVNIDNVLRKCSSSDNYFLPISLLRPRFLVPQAAKICVEVRVYYVTTEFFREVLVDAYKAVRDDKTFFLEHAYHQAITRHPATAERVRLFPEAPEITGMSGSNGWIFRERGPIKKLMIRLAARLGYIRPV